MSRLIARLALTLLILLGVAVAAHEGIPEPIPDLVSASPREPSPEPAALSPLPLASPLPEATASLSAEAPPRLLARDPSEGRLAERRPAIRLTFDRPMDLTSVAAALHVEPSLSFRLRQQGEVLIAEPRQPLEPGVLYRFTLEATATDQQGVPLERSYRWSYWVQPLQADLDWRGKRGELSAPLILRFNYSMDPTCVEQALTIEPAIEGEMAWDAEYTQVVITPTVPLLEDADYTLRFTDPLCSAEGDEFPPLEPLTFSTPSPILAVSPRAGDQVHPASIIEVTFDRPMDPARTEAAFQIRPAVAGRFEWQETTLRFLPEEGYLEGETEYTVTITTEAADAQGDPILRRPHTWSFRTGPLREVASFGYGPNAQVVDADGRRAVQFQLFQGEPTLLVFELYRLDVDQFLDRYASGFRGVAGFEDRPISTQGAVLVRRWEVRAGGGGVGWKERGTGLARPRQGGLFREAQIPQDVPPGLYVLNLKAGRLNDQLLLILTRHVVALKQSEGQIVAWVTDINGGSVPNAEVSVYARDGTLISRGRTDANGLYRTQVSRDPQPLIVVARVGDDLTATGLSNEWLSRGHPWWWWWRPAPQAPDYAVYIYTDRPIYRPGQTVFFKAILRRDDDAQLSLPPEGTPVTVRLRDARNNVVRTVTMTTNAFGTVHGQFSLAEGAMLGDYAIEVALDDDVHRQPFKVQDYRKPDYQVTVTTDAEHYVAGQPIQVRVEARYFFGEPVANAQLVVRQYTLRPYYWWDERGEEGYAWYASGRREIKATTDANGVYTFTLEARSSFSDYRPLWGSSLKRTIWGIEVTADDGSHQTVSGFTVVRVFNAAEKLTLETGGRFKAPGQPFFVRARATTLDGGPLEDRTLRLELRRYNRRTGDYSTVVRSVDLTTEADGRAQAAITVEEPGFYQVFLSDTDEMGHEVFVKHWLYVFHGTSRWTYFRDGALHIAADKERYLPGETARLVIESTFSGPALLTFERGTTRRAQPIQLTAPLTLIEVPIRPDDAPNIFVTVNAWEPQDTAQSEGYSLNRPDSQLHVARVELQVAVTGKRLQVTITPDKASYLPREEATFTIRVTNERGEPVSAEVSLALVDEAIFSLSEDLTGPIFDAFYRPRPFLVRTYDGMALRRWAGGRGGGGGGEEAPANPRSDFPDTAAWVPILHTDWKGEAVVTLRLPDNLTRWRLTARAVTPDTQVGEAITTIVTHQEIVVRPLLPRSLTAGDEVVLSAFVHNYGDRPRQVTVAIASDRLTIHGSARQTLRLAPGERRIVGWTATASTAGEAEVLVQATTDGPGDAVRLTFPIHPLAVPQVETQVGAFQGEMNLAFDLPEGALAMSQVQVQLSRSVAGSLLHGLEFLTGFPYGCVEQTMSRALPNAVVGRAFHQLGIGNPTLQADLPPKINAGLQRLYGFQHNDGGWGWWYDDSSHDYQTAWVVFGLAVTAEAGYEVDPEVIRRGADWLKEHLEEMDPRTRAYALYSLAIAGHGDLEATRTLAAQAKELDTFSQAALALALHELGATTEAQAILDLLAETATVTDGGLVYWDNGKMDGKYYRKTMASTTRSTALALSAFARLRPDHELVPGIVHWLMGRRRQTGWGTTNETAFAILALTDHLLATGEAMADTTYVVELNGQVIAAGTLGRGEPAVSLEIPASQMVSGRNRLRLRQSGSGRLYYVVSRQVYLPEAEIEAAGTVRVSRTYLDPKTERPIERAEAGQLVKVRLRVTLPDDGFYIIVEDPLPGGLEALNERLNTTSHEATTRGEPSRHWMDYGYNRKEVYGDRVRFFITELKRGERVFTYLARATRTGRFVAMPTEVWAMYDLTTWGRSASNRFTVGR